MLVSAARVLHPVVWPALLVAGRVPDCVLGGARVALALKT
jgi:hypothetical protein